DGFFYDVLCLPDGTAQRLKIRSMVGLLPLCAVTVVAEETVTRFPRISARVGEYLRRNADLLENIADPTVPGVHGRRLLSVLNERKLRRVLARMLDEERFLSPHGVRSLSRSHLAEPFRLEPFFVWVLNRQGGSRGGSGCGWGGRLLRRVGGSFRPACRGLCCVMPLTPLFPMAIVASFAVSRHGHLQKKGTQEDAGNGDPTFGASPRFRTTRKNLALPVLGAKLSS
ncbi:MAG: hypothetical protein ACLQNE_44000, partial [Thermoguttaceae bacterium]